MTSYRYYYMCYCLYDSCYAECTMQNYKYIPTLMHWILKLNGLVPSSLRPKMYPVSGLRARRLTPARRHLLLFCYETMSNCSQNCWIDWKSAAMCFKRLFHTGVWTFAQFVRPLLATILSTTKNHRTDLKPTYDQKPETSFGLIQHTLFLVTGNGIEEYW